MSAVIPEGWAAIKIEDIADVKGGKRLPKGESFSDEITAHPYLRVTDFYNETIDMSDLKYLKVDTHQQIANYIISKEDLYISIAGTIGLVGSIPPCLDGANLTENAAKICNISGINNTYLKRFLNSHTAKDQFKDKTTSSGQPKLALFRIRDCDLLLPPLAEQKIIADKLDELLAQVESTKARLDAIPAILKSFRQSVLAAAVSGKLTEEWRGDEDSYIGDIVTLGEVIGTIGQGWSPKCHNEPVTGEQWGVIKTSAVQQIEFIQNENKRLPESLEVRTHLKVASGDILTTRAGPRVRCGVTCYVENVSSNLMICDKVYRYKVAEGKGISKFLAMQLNSLSVLDKIEALKTGISESGMNLTQSKFKLLEINWPNIEEQAEIVRRVEELFAFADKVEAQVNAAQTRVNNLTQSILAKAFRGELTADWRAANPELISGDNSAQALLERIKAEREKLKPAKKTRAKKAKV
ncbi:restriction endonuclease subunit S [Shewanella algidipiscicola]|uniref:Type I restriction-modification system restriction endonuclease DNA specificity subunit HsdS n=1 Tax=Shewanella algidipiscicola TaxID=614070 RepID=A0ABQ4PGD6_9GAMM|nr:restriction endonuclease subunit S [Shewanella algidipiscicola]GIU46479.1 type I restriction-modification system restriction endonuclease DNA specificity subunit HsdS [Shewanella algidipiscicola]